MDIITDFVEIKDEMEDGFVAGDSVDVDISSSASSLQFPNPDFQNCVFCLQPQQLETLHGLSKTNPRFRDDFQTIIHFLTGTNPSPNVTFDDDDSDRDNEDGTMMNPIRWISNLPPVMCPTCHGILAELYGLHRELLRIQWRIQKRAEVARMEIVTKVLESPSASSISSGMSAEVSQLIRKLHNEIVMKEASGNKEVTFPSSLPPDFAPAHDLHHQPANSSRQMPKCSLTWCDNRLGGVAVAPSPPATSFRGRGRGRPRTQTTPSQSEVSTEEIVGPELVHENEDGGFIGPDLEDPDILETEMEVDGSESSVEGDKEEEYVPSPLAESESASSSSESSPSSPEPGSPSPNRKRKRRQQAHISASGGVKKPRRCRARPQLIFPLVVKGNVTSQHCDICGELCPSPEIRAHLEDQHHLTEFIAKCPNSSCPYVFSCRGKLEKHLTSDGGWANNNCRKKAKLPQSLHRKCVVCSFKTKSIHEFRRHLRGHEAPKEEKDLPCPLEHCDEKYALRQSLEDHLFTHDQEEWIRPRRKEVGGVLVQLSQKCDLCGEHKASGEIARHLEEVHHVQDFITKCINPDCDRVYSCRGKMERHLTKCRAPTSRQRGPTTIKCDPCQVDIKRFHFFRHLQEHELQLKDKGLSCPILGCSDRYSLRQSVEQHLVTHNYSSMSNQECSVCKKLLDLKQVADHLKESHNVDKPISCKRCPFLFHDWEPLLDHIYVHRSRHIQGGGGGFACELCDADGTSGIRFAWYELLRQHFFNVHRIGKQFICEECDKDFFSLRALAAHKKNQHSLAPPKDDQRPRKSTKITFKCDHCPELSFGSKVALLNHQMKLHGAPPLSCKLCEESFTSVSKLQMHKRIHLGLQRSYKCNVENCGKVCDSLSKLKDHERGAHSQLLGASLLMCETCGKEYVTEQSLKKHVDKVHLGKEKPRRVCEICGESFVSGETLRRHNLIHTGERPHQCSLCGQAFRTLGVLATHVKGHEEKGDSFKPNGPMKHVRKRVERK